MTRARADSFARGRAGKKNIRPDPDLFHWWCHRWGYVPAKVEIGNMLGLRPEVAMNKINHRGFFDKEKIIIAKEFELTAQEFVDLFYPGCFHPDGNIILARDRRTAGVQRERITDAYPMRNVR